MTEYAAEADAFSGEPGRPATASAGGCVVLDLGPGVGALVLYAPPDLEGAEIEISPVCAPDGPRTHSLVRSRVIEAAPGGGAAGARQDPVIYAAVYPGLMTGRYVVWRHGGTKAGTVTIKGGEVTSWHWPETASG